MNYREGSQLVPWDPGFGRQPGSETRPNPRTGFILQSELGYVFCPQKEEIVHGPSTGHILMLVRKAEAELNQALQVIAMEAHMLVQSTRDNDPNRRAIVAIDQAVSRAITLSRELLGVDDPHL